MRKINLQSLMLIFLIVAGIGIIVLLQTKDSSFDLSGTPRVTKGVPAPAFSLPGLDGNMVNLDDYKGKIVLLNIWATWCPPCVAEMPSMEKLYQELKEENFEILAVSIDVSGSNVVAPFMKKHRLSFPALTDTQGTIKDLYQTTGVPESFILDKDGIIAEKVIGPREWATPEVINYFRNMIQTNSLGSEDAKIYLVKFTDPGCETCSKFHPFVKKLMSIYQNKIKLVIRYAPFHKGADEMVKILEASRKQGKYWETLEVMYESQGYWASHHDPQPQRIWEFLPKAGLDLEKIRVDMNAPEIEKIIKQDMADAKTLNVSKTPGFFVNGRPLSSFGYKQLQELVESEIISNY